MDRQIRFYTWQKQISIFFPLTELYGNKQCDKLRWRLRNNCSITLEIGYQSWTRFSAAKYWDKFGEDQIRILQVTVPTAFLDTTCPYL